MDAETAHNLGLWAVASGFVGGGIVHNPRLACTAFGSQLSNPLGLAAGFDKNGVAAAYWQDLGFGFAEIGTVTPEAQPGNPKPRMFRFPEDGAIINRLGFNNSGAREVVKNLLAAATRFPIGINLGKGIDTPLEDAADDYKRGVKKLQGIANYYVINVSSPNTPGLRDLQQVHRLEEIIAAVREMSNERLFVKISPDQSADEIVKITEMAIRLSLSGIIATNTTIRRVFPTEEAGGLSGKPLRERAEEVCRLVRQVGDGLEIVGVGGIFTGEDLYRRLQAGATVCQIYTSFVYRGPSAAALILNELLQCMDRDGISSVVQIPR
ncbi:MAG: quinone-dependent dihydroorotate dehydrogenase [Armatimonadetes bacterium]|nr:quinone-dependent dihydroorotate dehydrogenase [Armatimonadota bacterium]